MSVLAAFSLAIAGLFVLLSVYLFSQNQKLKTRHQKILLSYGEIKEKELLAANEEKDRIMAVLRSMAEGVLVLDTDQKVRVINSVFLKTVGLDRDRVEGRSFWEVIRDSVLNQMIQSVMQERVAVRKEHQLTLSSAIFDIQIAPVHRGEEFLGVVCVFHDVTRLKELERLRTEFVANVSHELKTPLTSIVGFVETLKEGAVEDEENRLKFLEIIDEQSHKLHRLIEDLLFLSRVESGQTELQLQKVEFQNLLLPLLRTFEKSLSKRGIRVHKQIMPENFFLEADPKLLEQVMTNLIDNAIKYNKDGGEITIRAYAAHPNLYIEVRDTGIGIPEGDLPRIFERFYRVDKSRARESGGSGLGLAIVKHILERHGGTIYASSKPGEGSIFTMQLPAKSA